VVVLGVIDDEEEDFLPDLGLVLVWTTTGIGLLAVDNMVAELDSSVGDDTAEDPDWASTVCESGIALPSKADESDIDGVNTILGDTIPAGGADEGARCPFTFMLVLLEVLTVISPF